MTTYNWNVSQTDYETSTGFIITAHWQCTAIDASPDETYTASTYATSSWAAGTPTIPYAQVTMAEVLNWIWNNGVDKAAVEASLAANIAAQKNPVTSTGTPWATA